MMNHLARLVTISAFACLMLVPATLAQDKPKTHVEIPTIPARPEDVASPEAIVKADYESIAESAFRGSGRATFLSTIQMQGLFR